MLRWLVLALLVAVQGENAPAADRPGSDQPAVRTSLNGCRRYSAGRSHCHGPDGVGGTFAPSLMEVPLPLAPFQEVVRSGPTRGASVMRGFADDPNVARHVGDIYAYLQARAAGTVGRGRPH